MRRATVWGLLRRTVHWLLLVVAIVFIISGFGITEFRTVETLTFGWLTKNLAFKIHISLWIPLLILLVLHICLPFIFKRKMKGDRPKEGK
jgi:cytochrome b561